MRELWRHFENEPRDLNIDECGIQQFSAGKNYNYIVYQNFVIHYIESGKGIYKVDGKKYNLSAGDGFIIRKGTEVRYEADSNKPWKNYWVGLSGNHLLNYLKKTTLEQKNILKFDKESKSAELIKHICNYTLKELPNRINDLWYLSNGYELLYNLEKEFGTNETSQYYNINTQNYSKIAFDYITNNYMYQITIQQVADFIGISRSYLYRQFKDEYDKSPQQFLQDYRMDIASTLLLSTQNKIYIIAEKVGYADQLQFSKVFKKHFGVSPSDYRNNN